MALGLGFIGLLHAYRELLLGSRKALGYRMYPLFGLSTEIKRSGAVFHIILDCGG